MKTIRAVIVVMLLLSATASAQVLRAPERHFGAWGGFGYDGDRISFSAGGRYNNLGVGFGYVRDVELQVPSFRSGTVDGQVTEKVYPMSSVGLDFFTFNALTDWLNLYASAGGYIDINTVLIQDSTGVYYESDRNPDWTNARLAFGGGLEATLFDQFLLGIGYHADRGFNAHLGYSW